MIPKFRAWDKVAKKMSQVTAIDFSTKPFRVFYKAYGNENYFNKDAILMQSTGFVDDNNIEIFEGDIVNCGYFTNGDLLGKLEEDEEKGIIEFLKGAFYIKFLYDRYLLSDIFESCTHIEVLGNIYENKELLED